MPDSAALFSLHCIEHDTCSCASHAPCDEAECCSVRNVRLASRRPQLAPATKEAHSTSCSAPAAPSRPAPTVCSPPPALATAAMPPPWAPITCRLPCLPSTTPPPSTPPHPRLIKHGQVQTQMQPTSHAATCSHRLPRRQRRPMARRPSTPTSIPNPARCRRQQGRRL